MEKYLHKYIFLKDGRCFYVRSIENGVACLYDLGNNTLVSWAIDESEIDYMLSEVCKAITVE